MKAGFDERKFGDLMLKRKSLAVRTFALFLLSFLAVALVGAFVFAQSLQRDIEDLVGKQQLSFVESLAGELDQKVRTHTDSLDRLARLMDGPLLRRPDDLRRYLATRGGVHGVFTGGLLALDHDGTVLAEYPDLGHEGRSLAERPAFAAAKVTARPVVSEPYSDPVLGQPVVSIIAPIVDGKIGVVGMLVGTMILTEPNFLGQLTEHQVGRTGGMYLISPRSDMIVVSSDKRRVFTPMPVIGVNVMLDRYRAGFEGSGITSSSKGIEELTSAKRVASTGWVLVARLPTAEAFQPIADIQKKLVFTMVGLSLALLTVLWVALRQSLRPMLRVAAAIRDMVSGRAELAPLPAALGQEAAEIGELITAFNALQGKLAFAEIELRRREAIYHTLFRGCKAVEMLVDPVSGRIIDANDAAEAYYGWPRDILTTMRISDINTLSPEAAAEEMRKVGAGERDHFHFRHRLASGEVRDVEVRSGPIEVAGQALIYSLVIDVTDRRRSEQEVRRLLAFRHAVLDGAGSMIIATDIDGTILLFNHTAERWLGYAAEEVVGLMTPQVFHDPKEMASRAEQFSADLEDPVPVGFETFVAKPLISGQPDTNEWTYIRKDGSHFRVLLSISALYDDAGELSGFLGVAQDISERLAMERELKRSNAELEHFAYVASHDLRQPLRMVASYVTLLQRRLGDRLDEEEQSYIAFATDGARRMDQMITDLLAYSRIGRGGTAAEPASLSECLARALESLSGVLRDTDAEVLAPSFLPTVTGNAVELERLFQNLIANAVKFVAAGIRPRVEINCADAGREWVISITDNGIGIDPRHRERLFQVFQRLVAQTEYEGTGIGLASCRKIVEHHGGRIWVESAPGEGSTFVVALPK